MFLKISLMKAEPPASASFKCSSAVSRIVTFFFGSFAAVRPELGLEPRCLRRWISSLVTWGCLASNREPAGLEGSDAGFNAFVILSFESLEQSFKV